jgi:hypothetical protein
MNNKILNRLQILFKASPHLLRDRSELEQAISAVFDVEVLLDPEKPHDIASIGRQIDQAVLKKYFGSVWQPKTKQYKYSGLGIIDEINSMKPRSVVDVGCGYNEFKGKINNLIGVDPFNTKADVQSSILDFSPSEKFDVTICLGSINFGSVDKIYTELEHVVNITQPGGHLFFRANPGEQHDAPEAQWIEFFDWTPEFIMNVAKNLNCQVLTIRQDAGNRLYFVLRRQG